MEHLVYIVMASLPAFAVSLIVYAFWYATATPVASLLRLPSL